MTMAGPLTVFGIRYCTYIWLMVMVPGGEGPSTDAPGWLELVVTPLTKKLPSSASSNGPPSDPAMAIPPVASSTDTAAAIALLMVRIRLMRRLPWLCVVYSPKSILRGGDFTSEHATGAAGPSPGCGPALTRRGGRG